MGWFDEQIRQRKLSDQELFEESIYQMASVVLGKQRAGALNDERIITKKALDDILKYYRAKPVEIPSTVRDAEEALEYCLRPHGIMRRNVRLEDGWYRDAFGPMIAFRREDGAPVALIPQIRGYWYRDAESGKKCSLNKKTAALFDRDAICFYRPLPLKKLGITDLIQYLKDCLNLDDFVTLAAVFLLGVCWKKTSPKAGMWTLIVGLVLGFTRLITMIVNPESHNLFTFIFNELNVYAFCVWMFLFCVVLAIVVTLLTPKPSEEQVQGLCFGTATPEQKAVTRASWGTWDIVHTVIILAFTVAFYIYFW